MKKLSDEKINIAFLPVETQLIFELSSLERLNPGLPAVREAGKRGILIHFPLCRLPQNTV